MQCSSSVNKLSKLNILSGWGGGQFQQLNMWDLQVCVT